MEWSVYNSLLFITYPIYCLRPSILSLLAATQIRGHIAGSSPPLRTTVRTLRFYRDIRICKNLSVFPS